MARRANGPRIKSGVTQAPSEDPVIADQAGVTQAPPEDPVIAALSRNPFLNSQLENHKLIYKP